MAGVGSESYKAQKARTAVRGLILALMGIGYTEPQAVEVTETVIEEAGRDGLEVDALWRAIDHVAPIQKDL